MSFVPTVRAERGVGAELAAHVGSDTGIGGGGRGQHRSVRVGGARDVGDAAVVGPEIVTPVRDGVRPSSITSRPSLPLRLSSTRLPKPGLCQALRGHQENIEIACA